MRGRASWPTQGVEHLQEHIERLRTRKCVPTVEHEGGHAAHVPAPGERFERVHLAAQGGIPECRQGRSAVEPAIGSQLREAADRLKSGTLVEALGLMSRERADHATATAEFRKAKLYYTEKTDRLRMDLHVAAIERAGDRKEEALKILRGARTLYGSLPESAAAVAWINLMDPPPPPPAAPAAPNE